MAKIPDPDPSWIAWALELGDECLGAWRDRDEDAPGIGHSNSIIACLAYRVHELEAQVPRS